MAFVVPTNGWSRKQPLDAVPQLEHGDFRISARSAHASYAHQHERHYNSPRGRRGALGRFGTADAERIEADFTGVDCNQANVQRPCSADQELIFGSKSCAMRPKGDSVRAGLSVRCPTPHERAAS